MSLTIAKLLKEYQKSGKIGRVSPMNDEHAAEIALAIVARTEREVKSGNKDRRK